MTAATSVPDNTGGRRAFFTGSAARAAPALLLAAIGCAGLAGPAAGADDPGARALQQHQLQRQQHQDSLQLRMQQQQRALQSSPPADSRQQQAARQLEIDQQQRQQEQHYREGIEPPAARPAEDEGTRRAKAQLELQKAQQQGQRELRRFDLETQEQAERRRNVEVRGEIVPPEPQ